MQKEKNGDAKDGKGMYVEESKPNSGTCKRKNQNMEDSNGMYVEGSKPNNHTAHKKLPAVLKTIK